MGSALTGAGEPLVSHGPKRHQGSHHAPRIPAEGDVLLQEGSDGNGSHVTASVSCSDRVGRDEGCIACCYSYLLGRAKGPY